MEQRIEQLEAQVAELLRREKERQRIDDAVLQYATEALEQGVASLRQTLSDLQPDLEYLRQTRKRTAPPDPEADKAFLERTRRHG